MGEPLNLGDKVSLDANAGVLYNYKHDYDAFFGGIALYNTFRHNESADLNSFKTPMRISVLSGGHLAIGYDQTLYASINYMNQAKASEITIGAAYGYQLGADKIQEIDFGIWHRVKDAIIPYVGYQLNGFQFGISYDCTISKIKTGALSRNGYELTLIYQGGDHSTEKRLMPWY